MALPITSILKLSKSDKDYIKKGKQSGYVPCQLPWQPQILSYKNGTKMNELIHESSFVDFSLFEVKKS